MVLSFLGAIRTARRPITWHRATVILRVNHHLVTSVGDYSKLAAEAKGQALLRIVHQGETLFGEISSETDGDE